MRRLLLLLPLLASSPCAAQTQAAGAVEPFSFGQRVGTQNNPFYAALSSMVPSANAATQAATPVEMFSYGQRIGTQANPIYVNLGNALSGYLTQSQASATYLPLSGGTITGPISGGYFMPQCYTVAALKALPTPSTVGYSCYLDPNNSNKPNLAVYALGSWRYLTLGNAL